MFLPAVHSLSCVPWPFAHTCTVQILSKAVLALCEEDLTTLNANRTEDPSFQKKGAEDRVGMRLSNVRGFLHLPFIVAPCPSWGIDTCLCFGGRHSLLLAVPDKVRKCLGDSAKTSHSLFCHNMDYFAEVIVKSLYHVILAL